MSKRTHRPQKEPDEMSLGEWARQLPEAKVTRRELWVILSGIFGQDAPEEEKVAEA